MPTPHFAQDTMLSVPRIQWQGACWGSASEGRQPVPTPHFAQDMKIMFCMLAQEEQVCRESGAAEVDTYIKVLF